MTSQQPETYRLGDRVRISEDVKTLPPLPGHTGVVKEIIPSYDERTVGYNVSIDDDPRRSRIWYFLHEQLTPA
jgi:hypothetical protein